MTECVVGKTVGEAKEFFNDFRAFMGGESAELASSVESLAPLSTIKKFPLRINCVLLSWQTLMSALESND